MSDSITGEQSTPGAGDGEIPAQQRQTSSNSAFRTVDVTEFRRLLTSLHEQVGCCRGRVEVKRRGCDDVCVLIGKAELEALERALEILCDSAEYKAMCDTVAQLAAATGTAQYATEQAAPQA